MPKKNTIATILNLQPEENRLVRLMLIHSFFIGIAQVFTATVASTLFLSEFDASMLPYTYIGVAVFVTLIGFIYAKLHAYLPFSTLLIVNLSAMFVSLFGFRLLLLFDSQWVVLAFYIWSYVVWIALNIEFWGLAGRIFTIRQGKRLFGLIGSGEVVSIILGGFSASALVKFVGTPNLLLVSASGIGLSLILLTYITRAYADGLLLPEEETKKPRAGKEEVRESLSNLIQNRYVMLIFGLSALSWFACYFVHNILYDRAGDRYTHENQLAAFFGTFYAVIGFVTLLSRIFITDRLMNRHGLKVGLLVLPVMIVAGAASFAIIGAMFGMIPIIFWLIAATRLFDKVCRDSVNRSSLMVLYQPLPADQRLRVQMMVESMADPIAAGVAGIALLFLTNVLSFGIIQLSYGLLCILSVWIMVAIMLQREYRTVLTNALAKRTLSGMALSLNDGSSVAVLQRRLQSPHAGEVIHALNMLKEIEHESLETFLIDLLEHPASEVRQDVLRSIEQLGVVTALEAVAKRVELEESSQVRGVALRTFAALGGALEQVLPYLEHSDPHIKLGAAVGLLRSGGIQGVLLAGADLLEQVTSADPVNRKHAAQVLGEVGVRDFYHPLLDLLKDDNLQVRQEALAAVEKLKNPQLWPLVVDNLSVPAVRTATVSALVAGGESALPVLEAAFAKKGQQRDVRIRIVRIFGQIRGDRAVQLLYDKISVPDREISYQALLSLSLCNYHVRDEDISIIEGRIEEEAAWAAWTLSALRDIKIDPTTTLLKTALENTFEQSRKRIFLLLAFIYDSESILRARDNLTHPSAGKRAYALEVIDNLISQKLKGLLFPLLDNLPLNQRLEHLNRTFPQETVDANRRLADIVNQAEKWGDFFLEACALYAIGKCGTVASIDTILSALSHPKPLVRETAAWALSQLDSTTFHEYLPQLKNDSSPHVADVVCRLDTAQDKDQFMFLTIEKTVALINVSIFSEIPEEILASAVSILHEVNVKAGEVIIRQGETGDCMYLIAAGRVHVYNETQSIAYLEAGGIVGEWAILTAALRSASVAAVEDTRLFRLGQDAFHELMVDRPEVVRGIIQVLCRRFRERVALAPEYQNRGQPLQPIKAQSKDDYAFLLPIEKVIILKTVDLFSQTPYPILAEIASILEEVTFKAGERIIEKGEIGNCMYIIISGQIRVHDGEQTRTYLGERAIFGEFAVLDSEPRTASVTAVEETRLFRIDQDVLYELMADRVEVAQGILRVLCQRVSEWLN